MQIVLSAKRGGENVDYLIGMDLGTTNIKAGAYDGDGRELAVSSARTPTEAIGGGNYEFDVEKLFQAVCGCISAVVRGCGGVKGDW